LLIEVHPVRVEWKGSPPDCERKEDARAIVNFISLQRVAPEDVQMGVTHGIPGMSEKAQDIDDPGLIQYWARSTTV
jgi:hypothetical protein